MDKSVTLSIGDKTHLGYPSSLIMHLKDRCVVTVHPTVAPQRRYLSALFDRIRLYAFSYSPINPLTSSFG